MTPTSTPIPCLVAFPQTMLLLKERLESLGFHLVPPEEAQGEAPIAFAPVGGSAKLDEISTSIDQLRAKFPDLVVIGIYSGRLRFKVSDAYRAGLNALYSLPLEEELLLNKLFELVPVNDSTGEITFDQLMRVNVVELEHAKSLAFDIYLYLPMNNKILLYLEKDHAIDEKVVRKFRENPHYSLYIRRSDLKKYLAYCTTLIASGEAGEEMEAVQAAKQTARRLAGLMGGFFNDETLPENESRVMLETLKSLIGELEDRSGSKQDIVKAVVKFASQQMTHYTHAQNVAAYSCLFGMAAGLAEPESLRMGGLLHDLGLSDLPNELLGRGLEEMSEEEQAKYKLHPGGGKYSIESRKLDVPAMALEMVLYHHERADGSGYPYGKKSAEIPLAAKICAFADEFDKLTSVRPGHRQLSTTAAMMRIAGLDGKPPLSVFEPAIHGPLVELFLRGPSKQEKLSLPVGPAAPARPTRAPGPTISIAELLKSPKFAKPREAVIDSSPATLQAALEELKSQLNEHWSSPTKVRA